MFDWFVIGAVRGGLFCPFFLGGGWVLRVASFCVVVGAAGLCGGGGGGGGDRGAAVVRGVSVAGSIFVWGGARRGRGVWFLVFWGFILVVGGGHSLWRGAGRWVCSMWFG